MTVKMILESCCLPTEYVDKIKSLPPVQQTATQPFNYATGNAASGAYTGASDTFYDGSAAAFESEQEIREKINRAKLEKTLKLVPLCIDVQFILSKLLISKQRLARGEPRQSLFAVRCTGGIAWGCAKTRENHCGPASIEGHSVRLRMERWTLSRVFEEFRAFGQ